MILTRPSLSFLALVLLAGSALAAAVAPSSSHAAAPALGVHLTSPADGTVFEGRDGYRVAKQLPPRKLSFSPVEASVDQGNCDSEGRYSWGMLYKWTGPFDPNPDSDAMAAPLGGETSVDGIPPTSVSIARPDFYFAFRGERGKAVDLYIGVWVWCPTPTHPPAPPPADATDVTHVKVFPRDCFLKGSLTDRVAFTLRYKKGKKSYTKKAVRPERVHGARVSAEFPGAAGASIFIPTVTRANGAFDLHVTSEQLDRIASAAGNLKAQLLLRGKVTYRFERAKTTINYQGDAFAKWDCAIDDKNFGRIDLWK